MGIFDSLKDIALKSASAAIDKAQDAAEEKIREEIREKGTDAVTGGIKTYLNNAQEKVTTEDGKEAISMLQNLVEDAENIHKTATDIDPTANQEHIKKAEEDLQKLADFSNKYN